MFHQPLPLPEPPELPVVIVMTPLKASSPTDRPSKGLSIAPERVLHARTDRRPILLF